VGALARRTRSAMHPRHRCIPSLPLSDPDGRASDLAAACPTRRQASCDAS
jgi:hypothetical protein